LDAFTTLALVDRIRAERLLRAEKRCLRLRLLAQRSLIAARLEERQLAQLTSDPRFQALSEQAQGVASFAFVQDRATLVSQAIRNLQRGRAADSRLKRIRQAAADESAR
jgi:hypothetical protein